MKKIILYGIPMCLLVLAMLVIRPLDKASSENCKKIEGTVSEVLEGEGAYDVIIDLIEDDHYYYINRGLERGLVLDDFRKELKGNLVSIDFIKHWTPLDPKNKSRHVARVSLRDRILYSEIDESI